MPDSTISAPAAAGAIDRLTVCAADAGIASSASNWWSGMAGVPFAEMAQD